MAAKEKVRIRPPQAKDRFNSPVGPVPEWIEVNGATVVPRTAEDYEQRGPIIVEGFMVRLPASVTIGNNWDVEVRGNVHEIDGAVADFRSKGKILYTMRPT